MQTRTLGPRHLEVSAIGFGAMGFSHGYGPGADEEEAIGLMRYAVDQGCTHFDTAEAYGAGHNEQLVGRALAPLRDQVSIATKFRVPGRPRGAELEQAIREHLTASLERLGTDRVELYYLHRTNPEIPLEDMAGAIAPLIEDGLIGGWGLSQVTEDELRRAHAVTPVTAVQSEYSMMERMFERDVLPTCAELGVGFVPFSPLASGFLSGTATASDTYTGDDVRRVITRFAPDNVRANQPLLDLLRNVATEKQATPAQISLAWMLHKYPFVVPIPGMRRRERIDENLGAADVHLDQEEFERIEAALARIEIHGDRTDEDIARLREEG